MSKVSFIIPIYPPHYVYLDFLDKIQKPIDFDIIFVLSFMDDAKELFNTNYNKIYNVIIFENFLPKSFICILIKKKIIITFKKYFALSKLKNTYSYCATIDAEIEFVNTNNILHKFQTFDNNKKIIGSSINTHDFRHALTRNINIASASFFLNNEKYKTLESITNNFNIYFWFSDIPIYNMSHIDEFMEFINFANYEEFAKTLTWSVFDYIPYAYFISLFKNFSIVNIKDYGLTREWSLESMPMQTYNMVVKNINYYPLWVIYNLYNENKDMFNDSDIILTYHRNDGRYNFVNDNI